jgi:hypothetical protein
MEGKIPQLSMQSNGAQLVDEMNAALRLIWERLDALEKRIEANTHPKVEEQPAVVAALRGGNS